jgi:arachidonate 15-lipoxygenase
MVEGGDFADTFSLTHRGMCRLFYDTYTTYRISTIDPRADALWRGILDAPFATPSQGNLQRLFDVMHRHARRCVEACYAGDAALREDAAIAAWLDELGRLIPNGLDGALPTPLTREGLARLIASFIYLASVQHEVLGTGMWNYQLWTDRIPVRVYRDGRREPLDVYQRLVNANFNLNVHRTQLLEDFSYLALDERGAALFREFRRELTELDATMRAEPDAVWRITPGILEANINA